MPAFPVGPIRPATTAAALLAVLLLAVVVRAGWAAPLDLRLIGLVRHAGGDPLRRPIVILTDMGTAPVTLSLLAAGVIALLLRGHRALALRLALTALAGRLLVELAKAAMMRPRPPLADPAVVTHGWSFPSAHAANAAITYGALALAAAAAGAPRRPTATLAALLACAIGCSRVWLGVHWPSDVLAGWLFGIAILSASGLAATA